MSLKADIQNALDNKALHDVCLIGSDNMEVSCSKFVLAMRSPVFQKMFFGEDRECDGNSVKLDYPSIVLKTLVKYCHSDALDFDQMVDKESMTDEEVNLMFDLRDCANRFEFSDVTDHVFGTIGNSIFHNGEMSCVCAVLASLNQRGEAGSPFWNVLIALVKNEPEACLLPTESPNKGIKAVPLSLLTQILENIDDPYVVACCLKEWRTQNLKNETESSSREKEYLLADLANATDLKSIPAERLAILKPCDLFSTERLHEALSFRVQGNFQQAESFLREGAIFVSGAGLKSVDGYYSKQADQFALNQYCFKKKGTFESQDSEFTLQLIEGRWKISIQLAGHFFGGRVLYEAPIGSLLSFSPNPSCVWTCVEGPSPAPIVVEMERKIPMADFSQKSVPKPIWGDNPVSFFAGTEKQQQQSSFDGFSFANRSSPAIASMYGPDFRPTPITENTGNIALMAVTAMKDYQDKSFEELRLEHHRR